MIEIVCPTVCWYTQVLTDCGSVSDVLCAMSLETRMGHL